MSRLSAWRMSYVKFNISYPRILDLFNNFSLLIINNFSHLYKKKYDAKESKKQSSAGVLCIQ